MSIHATSRGSARGQAGAGTTLRRLCLLCLCSGLILGAIGPAFAVGAQSARPRVVVAAIDGTITPAMERYVSRAISRAEADNAAAIVFTMDTPGGLGSAMDDIVRDILQSTTPVVVYVTPRGARAASAGVYIAYAAHVAAMAPGTNIGSASPIFEGPGGATDGSATLKKKVTNDAVAQITNLATLRGRNVDWAVKAVRDADNITADQALGLGVVDLLAADVPTLLAMIDGRTVQMASGSTVLATKDAQLVDVGMNWVERLLQLLSDSTIAYLLVSFGLLGLYIELSHPGVTVPGVVGGLSLLLGLFGLGTLPVNWAGALLIGLAFILFAADLFVPSFGTLTLGGLVSFVLGSYLLISDDAPPGFAIARSAIWAMAACLVLFSVFLAAAVLRARMRPPVTGRNALIGEVGEVRSGFAPRGVVKVHGELWDAELSGGAGVSPGAVGIGAPVVVTDVQGMRVTVRPATGTDVDGNRFARSDARQVIDFDRPPPAKGPVAAEG